MSTPAAGWFPDPAGHPDGYRWWDGAGWTRYLTDDAASPAPTAAAAEDADPPEDRPASPAAASAPTPSAPSDPSSPAEAPPAHEAGRPSPRPMPPGYDFARRPRPAAALNRRRFAPLVSILVAVVVGVVVVTIAVRTRTEATSLLDPPPPVSSTAAARVRADFDENTRVLTMPSLQVTMPGPPYKVSESEYAGYGMFSDGVEGEVIVENDSERKSDKWVSTVAAGVLKPELAGKDLKSTADKVFDTMVESGFSDMKVKITKAKSQPAAGYSDKAWIANGQVHYHRKGIDSTYDAVSVLVVDAGDGRYVGWLSGRPNKSDPSVKAAISASVKTIKIS